MQNGSPSSLRLLTAAALATVLIGFSLLVCGEGAPTGHASLHSKAAIAASATSGDDAEVGLRILGTDSPCDAPEKRADVVAAVSGDGDGSDRPDRDIRRVAFEAQSPQEAASFAKGDEAPDLRRLAVLGIILLGAGALGVAARRGRRQVLGVGAAMVAIVGVALFWKLCADVAAPTESHFAQSTPATIAAETDVSHVAGPYLGDGHANGHSNAGPVEPVSLDERAGDPLAGATPAAWQDEDGSPSHRLLVLLGVGVLGAGALGAASRFGRRRFAATALALLGLALIALFWQVCSGSGIYDGLFGANDDTALALRADATGTSGFAAGAAGLPGLAHAGSTTQVRGGAPAVAFRSGGTRGGAGLPAVGAGPAGRGGSAAVWGPANGNLGATYLSDPGAIVSVQSSGPAAVWWEDGDSTGGGGGGGGECQTSGCNPPSPAVPEPSAGLLFAAGLAAAATRLRRRG